MAAFDVSTDTFAEFQALVQAGGTINVTASSGYAEVINNTSNIRLNSTLNVDIVNDSGVEITFDGGGTEQLFAINDTGVNVSFNGFTFTNADSAQSKGGAIEMKSGTVSILNSTFSNNDSNMSGGAISIVGGTLDIGSSLFPGNSSADYGGAINTDGGVVDIMNSKFEDNFVVDDGHKNDGHLGAALFSDENTGSESGTIYVSNSVFEYNYIDSNDNGIADANELSAQIDGDLLDDFYADNSDSNGSEDEAIIINTSELDGDPLVSDPPGENTEEIGFFIANRFDRNDSSIDESTGSGQSLGGIDFFGAEVDDWSGSHLESAGDVNGDGYDDFLIASPYHGSGGAVYLIFGNARESIVYTDLADLTATASSVGVKIEGSSTILAEVGSVGDLMAMVMMIS